MTNLTDTSSGYRAIKDGRQYDHLFPPAEHTDKIILKNGEVNDTVGLMGKIVRATLSQTKALADRFKSRTLFGRNNSKHLFETCRKLWDFLYHHVQYKLDKRGLEELRQPARSWANRHTGIDCDCFSIFVSSILSNLGIEHKFRITKYGGKPNFQHVYVVVPNGNDEIIIDCVLSQFNYEKPYSEKKDFIMKPTINELGGIDIAMLSGVGRTLAEVIDDVNNKVHFEKIGDFDKAILAYLQDLRIIISRRPQLCSDPQTTDEMLGYLIDYWDTPHREQALENLCKNASMLGGLGDFGKLFKNLRQARVAKKEVKANKKIAKKEAKVAKKVARQENRTARKVAKQERKIAKRQAKTDRKLARQETRQARIAGRVEKRAIRQENRTNRVALRKAGQAADQQPEFDQDEQLFEQDDQMVYDNEMNYEMETPNEPEIENEIPTYTEPSGSSSPTTPAYYRHYPRRHRGGYRRRDWDDDFDDDWDDDEDDWDDDDDFDDDWDDDDDDFENDYDDYDMDGTELGFFKRNPQKKAAKQQAKAEKKVAKKEEKARIKALPKNQRLKARVKQAGKAIVKFNPLTLASRGGVLLAMKMNIGKMASKLKWGYATQADVDAGKLTPAQWEASKKALLKTETIFTKIGGDKAKLRIAIIYGKGGNSTLKNGQLGLCGAGLGEVATGAAIAAAIPVIISIINALQESGIMKSDEAASALALLNNPGTVSELEFEYENELSNGGGESFFQKNKEVILLGGAAALGLTMYMMTGKENKQKKSSNGLSGVRQKPKRKLKKIVLF
ncbi:MAG: hypothetical protein FWE63_02005 [Bacteroidales bacterium]|nr:hypothetical protein [Bacteroidales bacterium]